MNKKAITEMTLATIVLAIIVFAVIAIITTAMIRVFSVEQEKDLCKFSVLAADKAKFGGHTIIDYNFECERIQTDIEAKKALDRKTSELNKDYTYGLMAKRMKECADVAGLNPLEGKSLNPFSEWEGDEVFCLVCSEIRFDEKFQEKHKTIQTPDYWMAINPVPGTNTSFFKRMFGREPTPEELAQLSSNPVQMETDKAQVVVWRVDLDGKSTAGLAASTILPGAAAGITAGYWVGSTTGAVLGSIVPGPGTAIGYGVGTAVGVFVGGVVGLIGGTGYFIIESAVGNTTQEIWLVPEQQLVEEHPVAKGRQFCNYLIN